jgi:hypothetical protein
MNWSSPKGSGQAVRGAWRSLYVHLRTGSLGTVALVYPDRWLLPRYSEAIDMRGVPGNVRRTQIHMGMTMSIAVFRNEGIANLALQNGVESI